MRTQPQPPFDPPPSRRHLGLPFSPSSRCLDGRSGNLHRLALLALLACAFACSEPAIDAHWRQREIQIDGALADWQGWQVSLPEADARLAVANDESFLYLSLATSNPDLVRQLTRHGLTIWFDSAGGRAQGLGLRLAPARLPPPGVKVPGGKSGAIELLGPAPGAHRWVTGAEAEALGVRGAVAHEGSLVYELRVPIGAKEGWSLKPAAAGRLGIGLATPEGFGSPEDEKTAWERGWAAGGEGPSTAGLGIGDTPPDRGTRTPTGAQPGGVGGPTGGGFEGPGGPAGREREGRGPSAGELRGPSRGPLEVWAVVRLAAPGSK